MLQNILSKKMIPFLLMRTVFTKTEHTGGGQNVWDGQFFFSLTKKLQHTVTFQRAHQKISNFDCLLPYYMCIIDTDLSPIG